MKIFRAIIVLSIFCFSTIAFATCSVTTSGQIELKIDECSTLNPQKGSNSYRILPGWVHDLDPANKKKLLDSHTGILIKGKVTESKAVQRGLGKVKSALKGTKIRVFIHKSQNFQCSMLKDYVKGSLSETCCDGGGKAPCLWKTGYNLNKPKTAKKTRLKFRSAPDKVSKELKKLYKKKLFAKIIYQYGFRGNDFPNDVEFQYYVGMSFFLQENCRKSIDFFKRIRLAYGNNVANLAHKNLIKAGIYNLAVCHSRDGLAAEAVSVLNGMKLDKVFFQDELRKARTEKDFGRIKNSKEWAKFLN